jgi:hypothetical protein
MMEVIKCACCGESKPISEFWMTAKENRFESEKRCSRCLRYERYADRDRDKSKRQYAEKRIWWASVKSSIGCQVCGETFPNGLDWHHVDPQNKTMFLMSANSGKERLLREIRKCTLLCRVCHQKVHAGVIQSPPPMAGFEWPEERAVA